MAKDYINSNSLIPFGKGARFSIGDAVRVRAGIIDPDYPDIPLSGWAGVIVDIEQTDPPMYLVQWSRETLAKITPVYRIRCYRAGTDIRLTTLAESDLEPDTGGPLRIVQPTKLLPARLDSDDPQDRIRAIFGLTSDYPLPKVDASSLRRFHEHFRKKLKLPAPVHCEGAPVSQKPAKLVRLMPFEETETEEGLLVQVEQGGQVGTGPLYDITLLSQKGISQDIDAYSEWFFEDDDEDDEDDEDEEDDEEDKDEEDDEEDPAPGVPELFFGRIALGCILIGALVGGILWVHELAATMLGGGAILGGLAGTFWGSKMRYDTSDGRTGILTGLGIMLMVALMIAMAVGAAGALLLAYVGAIPGALAGTVLGMVLTACGVRNHSTLFLALLGGYIGAVVHTVLIDSSEALAGALRGAGVGLGAFLFVIFGVTWVMSRISRWDG